MTQNDKEIKSVKSEAILFFVFHQLYPSNANNKWFNYMLVTFSESERSWKSLNKKQNEI